MKFKLLSFLCCLVGILAGCNDDDSAHPGLIGSWNLTHVGGGLAGVDDSFGNKITWTFKPFGALAVDNKNTDDTLFDLLESGTYHYRIEADETGYELFVEDVSFGAITEGDDQLLVSNVHVDGFTLTLVKNVSCGVPAYN